MNGEIKDFFLKLPGFDSKKSNDVIVKEVEEPELFLLRIFLKKEFFLIKITLLQLRKKQSN